MSQPFDNKKLQELIDYLKLTNLSDEEQQKFVHAIEKNGLTPELHDELDQDLFMKGGPGLDPEGMTDIELQMVHLMENRNKEVGALFETFSQQFEAIDKKFEDVINRHDAETDAVYDQVDGHEKQQKALDLLDEKYDPEYEAVKKERHDLHEAFQKGMEKIDQKYQKKYEALS